MRITLQLSAISLPVLLAMVSCGAYTYDNPNDPDSYAVKESPSDDSEPSDDSAAFDDSANSDTPDSSSSTSPSNSPSPADVAPTPTAAPSSVASSPRDCDAESRSLLPISPVEVSYLDSKSLVRTKLGTPTSVDVSSTPQVWKYAQFNLSSKACALSFSGDQLTSIANCTLTGVRVPSFGAVSCTDEPSRPLDHSSIVKGMDKYALHALVGKPDVLLISYSNEQTWTYSSLKRSANSWDPVCDITIAATGRVRQISSGCALTRVDVLSFLPTPTPAPSSPTPSATGMISKNDTAATVLATWGTPTYMEFRFSGDTLLYFTSREFAPVSSCPLTISSLGRLSSFGTSCSLSRLAAETF